MITMTKSAQEKFTKSQQEQGRKKRSTWLDAEEFIQVKWFIKVIRTIDKKKYQHLKNYAEELIKSKK